MSALPSLRVDAVVDEIAPHQSPFRVRLAGDGDAREVLALLAELVPEADPRLRYEWLYRRNPGGPALTWLAIDELSGGVVGLTSFFPFRLWQGGGPARGALGGDGFVRPAFRRKGVGAMLHAASRAAMREHGIVCMYGAPGPMNVTPLEHAGSRVVAPVARWVRPLTARALARPGLAPLFAMARPRSNDCVLAPIEPHDPRVDEVWVAAREDLRLAAARDGAFYTWRFLEAPAHRQEPYVIIRRGRPIAACALERLARGVRVVDLIAPDDEWHHAMHAICAHAAHAGADLVDIKLLQPDGRRRHLWRRGMIERDAKPFLVMVPPGDDRSAALDPARWYYTGADSDLDFLE